jgi:tripartite-type tricarboxylate transporter receptor subunit TctC
MRSELIGALAVLALMPAATGASAQAPAYPTRPVKLVLAFGAGGSVDVIARLLSGKIGESWGQVLVVENKPGADGDLAGEAVARSAPDGYTLLLTSQAVAVNVSLRPKRSYKIDELAPVMLLAETQAVLAVPNAFPAKSVKEVIDLAKAQPGKFDYGSTGIGTSGHMAMELFRITAGIDVVHVPFRNIGQWMTDLVAGRIALGMPTIPAASGHIKSGRLRALGASGTRRSAALPDVPTVAEAGLPGYSATTWYGVFAPRGTPEAVIARVNAAFRAGMDEPANKARLGDLGVEGVVSTPAQLAEHTAAEVKRWAEVIQKAGIKPE